MIYFINMYFMYIKTISHIIGSTIKTNSKWVDSIIGLKLHILAFEQSSSAAWNKACLANGLVTIYGT